MVDIRKRWGFLRYNEGKAVIHGVEVASLTEKYGSPLLVIVEDEIRKQLRRMKKAFPYDKLDIQYACKCNSNIEILKIIREEGGEIDASSTGEIALALLAGFRPAEITLTNIYKTEEDIRFAAKAGIKAITADSFEEIRKISDAAKAMDSRIRIFLRINPMIEFKGYTTRNKQFGIPYHDSGKALEMIDEDPMLELKGLHFHGNYIKDPKAYFLAVDKLLELAKGRDIRYLDLGGGFPVPYGNEEVFEPEDMGEQLIAHLKKKASSLKIREPRLILEPGRFIVANSGVGITQVLSRKKLDKDILIVDSSSYSFAPDILVCAHKYEMLPGHLNLERKEYRINGCTCDSLDVMRESVMLPEMQADDNVLIMDLGAYSNVLASNFNTQRRSAIVMIDEKGNTRQIRRRDRYSEMFAPELREVPEKDVHELMQKMEDNRR